MKTSATKATSAKTTGSKAAKKSSAKKENRSSNELLDSTEHQCGCGCGRTDATSEHLQALESGELLSNDDVEVLSAFFKALSDPSRLNIVILLLQNKNLSVGEIAEKTSMSISAVSHQLATLRMRKLVSVKRDGVKNFYALNDDHVSKVIELAIEHIKED